MNAIEMKASMLQNISGIDESQVALIEQLSKAVQRILAAAKKERGITREDLVITPFVASIGEGIRPLSADFDIEKAKEEFLMEKYG